MFYFKKWEVLLVDDEPDVLKISELAMKGFEVYGLPLNIHTAQSKAEAIEFLNSRPDHDWAWDLSVAFIDVVMETDTAGLELCKYIREEMDDRLTQLFIRTGQPGIAPERDVIDIYDINGYFTKVEAIEEKIYSLVKSGVRQFLWANASQSMLLLLNGIIDVSDSQQKIEEFLKESYELIPIEFRDLPVYLTVNDRVLIKQVLDEKSGAEQKDKLDKLEGTQLSSNGDKYVRDDDNSWFIKVAPEGSKPEVFLLYRMAFAPPENLIFMLYQFLRGLANLWDKAE